MTMCAVQADHIYTYTLQGSYAVQQVAGNAYSSAYKQASERVFYGIREAIQLQNIAIGNEADQLA